MAYNSGLFADPSTSKNNEEEIDLLHEQKEQEEDEINNPILIKPKSKKRKLNTVEQHRENLNIVVNDEPFKFPDSGIHLDNDTLARPGGTDEVIPQQYTFFDPDEIDWDEVKEAKHNSEDDEYCHDCDNEQTEEQREINPAVTEYRAHYEEHVMNVEPVRLARQIQNLYNLKVRRFTPRKRYYPCKMIHEHFNYHVQIPRVIRVNELRNMNRGMRILRQNGLYKRDQEGKQELEDRHWKSYMTMMNKRDALLEKTATDRKR